MNHYYAQNYASIMWTTIASIYRDTRGVHVIFIYELYLLLLNLTHIFSQTEILIPYILEGMPWFKETVITDSSLKRDDV